MLEDRYTPLGPPQDGRCPVRARVGAREVELVAAPSDLAGEPDLQERLAARARARHPGLLPLLEFGVSSAGSPELGLGPEQPFWIQARRQPAELAARTGRELLAVTAQLLSALELLHARGLVFGDLTAAHVMCLPGAAGSLPRVALAGLGRTRGTSGASSAAPERRAGAPATVRSDLYGLGALVQEALGSRDAPRAMRAALDALTREAPAERASSAGLALRDLVVWEPRTARTLARVGLSPAPLIGRAAPLEDLVDAASDALLHPGERPTAWFHVVGEAGSGRSRLIDELAHRAQVLGVAWLELGREDGASPFELSAQGPTLAVARDLDRMSEDLQAQVLEQIKRCATARPHPALAFVTSAGPPGAKAALADALAAAQGLAPPHTVSLAPLPSSAMAELLAAWLGVDEVPAPLTEHGMRWCGGNPGLARAWLQRVLEAGAVERTGQRVTVDETALAEAAGPAPTELEIALPLGLTRDARRVLRAVSVAHGVARLDQVQTASGLGDRPFTAALELLVELGLLRQTDAGLAFERVLVEQHVEAGLSKRERQRLHRVFLDALEAEAGGQELDALDDAHVDRLAEHALALGAWPTAARVVPEAARRDVAAGAPRRAAQRLSALLDGAKPSALPAERRVALFEQLGLALRAAHRPAQAEEAFARALSTRTPKVGPLERTRLHRLRGHAALGAGDPALARDCVKRAERSLAGIERDAAWHTERAQVVALAATEASKAGRHRDVLARTGVLLRELQTDPDASRGTQASLWNMRGLARFYLGEHDRARRLLRRALRLCRELDHQVGISVSLGNLACVAWSAGDAERALRLHTISGRVGLRAGVTGQVAKAHTNLGNVASARGQLRRARARFRRSLALHSRLADDQGASLALSSLADTYLAEQDPVRARAHAERAAAVAQATSFPYGLAVARANGGEAALLLGDLLRARELTAEALTLRRELAEPARLVRSLALAAQIELRLGRDARAAELLEEADAALALDPAPLASGDLALARGLTALLAGEHADARDQLGAAQRAYEDGQQRSGVAAARLWVARSWANEGDMTRAKETARRSLAEAEACNARGLAAEARVFLAAIAPPGSSRDPDRVLDRLREARDLGQRRALPELVRAASATRARWLRHLGRDDQAAVDERVATRKLEELLAPLPANLAQGHRRWVRILAPEDDATTPPTTAKPPARATPTPAPAPSAASQLESSLLAAQSLFGAKAGFALRSGAEGWSPASGSPDVPTPDLYELAARAPCADSVPEHGQGLAVLVGRRGALVLLRDAAFAPAELDMAERFAAALAPWLHPDREAPPRTAAQERFGIVGASPAVRELLDQIERFGPVALPVLVHGESGSGKELVARALHTVSPRRNGPFVAANLGALAESLVAVELFGASAGAYTGAEERPGLFELAHGGTLLLDEVGDAPSGVQAMLLRVLEERQVRRVGADAAVDVDVRVVSATHRDLRECVRQGTFRQDLYYRLSGLTVNVPPLRARAGDARLLARRFARQAQAGEPGAPRELSEEALAAIESHGWPGNVRELKNAVDRAVALGSRSELQPEDLGLASGADPRPSGTGSLADLEAEAIRAALAQHPTLTAAAIELGIDRRTLRRRMRRHGIERPSA